MFDPTKEVPNLELCRKLKELGYPQEGGGWYWINPDGKGYFLSYFETSDYLSNMDFKAPTCPEMEEWFPANFRLHKDKKNLYRLIQFLNYEEVLEEWIVATTLPNAYAKAVVWLKENGYIKFQERKEV